MMHNPLKKPGCGGHITFFPGVDVPSQTTDKTENHAILASYCNLSN